MHISPINNSWNATSANWNNLALSCDDPIVEQSLASKTTGWLEFDVTDYFTEVIENGINDNGIMLSCTTTYVGNSNGQFSFLVASENSNTNRIPKLDIEYTKGTGISNNFTASKLFKINLINNNIYFNNITNSEIKSVFLINLSGKVIKNWSRDFKQEKNLITLPKDLSKGTYIIHFNSNLKDFTHKIIKQ